MKKSLGRKQAIQNDSWLDTISQIETLVPYLELKAAEQAAIADIKQKTAGKRTAFAWSGGKDSIVLAAICEKAGVTNSMFAHSDLEYPAFLDWCLKNKPKNCEVINTKQNIDWLINHPEMLFPNSKIQSRWYAIVQRRAFTEYFFKNSLDVLLVGHRKADGNVVGANSVIHKKTGEVRYAPLADWSHEMILAYIHYYNLTLPPIYGWKNGYKCGTHPWAARMYTGSVANGWKEVYEIDASIVEKAAERIVSASLFLKEIKNEN